ncbi:hypothetical protein CNEO3_710010 [Clostridium neonatale]|uniref:Uncharacterized protein n=1 Tax=Clostridium neonatale TaxID=137838 RepID=A0AA86JNH2_9CLOT|nr:hypothetical protein CNEO_44867 [Clostridium neonatale]CAI3537338.1 hypothetical protein CNEO4_120047 [Clostridium neonatale]CAI3553363.1 hypothetical protein CNEO3_1150010 [Clostridium neonatale]CAI3570972.1 hypothetical protein CNEO3_110057 [Clostridium neonatale]CAI3617556.1 hypothetical protein CNEO3_100056 [Clostridium neonatale]
MNTFIYNFHVYFKAVNSKIIYKILRTFVRYIKVFILKYIYT